MEPSQPTSQLVNVGRQSSQERSEALHPSSLRDRKRERERLLVAWQPRSQYSAGAKAGDRLYLITRSNNKIIEKSKLEMIWYYRLDIYGLGVAGGRAGRAWVRVKRRLLRHRQMVGEMLRMGG